MLRGGGSGGVREQDVALNRNSNEVDAERNRSVGEEKRIDHPRHQPHREPVPMRREAGRVHRELIQMNRELIQVNSEPVQLHREQVQMNEARGWVRRVRR